MKTVVDLHLSTEEKNILASMVGKTFDKYRCDEFHYRPAVYQIVGVFVDNQAFAIENEVQPIDYYGSTEDVGVISVKAVSNEAIHSRVQDGKQVETPIGQIIQGIKLIEDTHVMSSGTEDLYEFSYTKAIVFVLPDRQLVLEKDVWLSEDIFIYRGAKAESKIMAIDLELEESDEYKFRATRTTTDLANTLSF